MKQFILFLAGWLFVFLFFAFICLLVNWKTMDYADCLHCEPVLFASLFLGWIGGLFAAIPQDKL